MVYKTRVVLTQIYETRCIQLFSVPIYLVFFFVATHILLPESPFIIDPCLCRRARPLSGAIRDLAVGPSMLFLACRCLKQLPTEEDIGSALSDPFTFEE
jgi:hypothetical protein